jgi:hypothetical protein
MSRVSISYKPVLPVMTAVFSSRLDPAAAEPGSGADTELDMRRFAAGSRVRRTTRLLWSLVGGSARSRFGLGAPRRSVDRAFQEYSPSAFDW